MFDPATDPLGIGVMARGRANRQQYEVQNLGHNMGPLSDPRWGGFMQAMQEAGVSGVADNSVGVGRGMFPAQTGTMSPATGRDNRAAFGQPAGVSGADMAMAGIDRATGARPDRFKRGR